MNNLSREKNIMIKTKIFRYYDSIIDVKLLTSLIITLMLIFSIFFIQENIISNNKDEDKTSTNEIQRTILPDNEFNSKLLGSSNLITIEDPTGMIDNYTLDESAGLVELNSSRGQTYRHYYNTTSQSYNYESDCLVNKTGVIAGTDWITQEEYPVTFFIRNTANETFYASSSIEATTIFATQENLYCVGIETFTGATAFYINENEEDWGHGQTIFYPRLTTGQLPDYNMPLYSWFTHLFVQSGSSYYDTIINDNSLINFESQSFDIQFEKEADLFKIYYELKDLTVFSQTFDFTFGIKYNITENLFHTINNIICDTSGFDDIGLTYDITGTPMSAESEYRADRIEIANTTEIISFASNETWDSPELLANISSDIQLFSASNDSFIFDFADMETTGFTEKILKVQEQLLPTGEIEKVISVGMTGLGTYSQGSTIEIDPIYYSPISSGHDVTLMYCDSTYTRKTGNNIVGYTPDIYGELPPFDLEFPKTTRKFFMLWDTGLTNTVVSTSNVELRMKCATQCLESGELVRFSLLADYDDLSPVESDSASTISSYWSSSTNGSVYHDPSTGTTSYLDVESLTDNWANSKGSDSIIKFRVESGTGMDSNSYDYASYYDDDASSSNKPRLEFTYVMITDNLVNNWFEYDSSGEITSSDDISGWALDSDNGGSYHIEDSDTNYLRIVNSDDSNDYGAFVQQFYYDYDNNSEGHVVSGDLRLKLDGTTHSQMAYVRYRFYDSSDTLLGGIIFYIREDEQSYTNYSTMIYFNLSPYGTDSASWSSNHDPGWFSYNKNLTECFVECSIFTGLDDESERDNISYVEVRTCLFTSYSSATEAMFDNISISSYHQRSDAARTLNIYNDSDYNYFIENIETYILANNGSSPSTYQKSQCIYEYIRNLKNTCSEVYLEVWNDLELISSILDDSELPSDCGQYAVLTSAIGRTFGINNRIIHIVYANETTDHLFAEFYWGYDWHNVDPDLGNFDNIVDYANELDEQDPTECNIIYEFYQDLNPRSDPDDLISTVVLFSEYIDSDYIL